MNKKRRPKKKIQPSNKISDHFSKKDFICKESGSFRISLGLVGALELLRKKVNQRITIVKGFESIESAEKKGKAKRNLHTTGIAADIRIQNFSAIETFKAAEEIEDFKGIGLNIKEDYVHVDSRKADSRSLWIEINDEEVEITQENRDTYLSGA